MNDLDAPPSLQHSWKGQRGWGPEQPEEQAQAEGSYEAAGEANGQPEAGVNSNEKTPEAEGAGDVGVGEGGQDVQMDGAGEEDVQMEEENDAMYDEADDGFGEEHAFSVDPEGEEALAEMEAEEARRTGEDENSSWCTVLCRHPWTRSARMSMRCTLQDALHMQFQRPMRTQVNTGKLVRSAACMVLDSCF